MVYRKRPAELRDKRPILDAMGRCRHVLTRAAGQVEIGSSQYRAIHAITTAIDVLAKLLVGDETYFHAGGSAPGSDHGKWQDSGSER